jgi:formate hydrogenlyase regulatory protein HycA
VIPDTIPIRREADHHTHYIGRYSGRRQYLGFVVAAPGSETSPGSETRWYAVLHLFDKSGVYLETRHRLAGISSQPQRDVIRKAHLLLAELLEELPSRSYGNVKVRLFSTSIDGHPFGLIDTSEPDEHQERVELLPNGLAFFPPWDGTYDT